MVIPGSVWSDSMNPMNLVCDPMFRVQTRDGLERMSLPQLLTALGTDRVESLPGLQRHQEDAFHIFLCYLAGAVLARAERGEPIQDDDFWRDGIRRLTGRADDCAWTLVVEDVMQPAFMQAPLVSAADIKHFKPKAATPDELDVLPTAKNHDLKASRVTNPESDDWIYALISLQTMSGVYGAGNYGIARMNSGTGSRACVGLRYGDETGERFIRDTRRLLALRTDLLGGSWPYRADGYVLVWNIPWDRSAALPLTMLDPFFIEIARPVRLIVQDGAILALGSTSKARIDAKEQWGVLGDPWIPVNMNDRKKGASALTVSVDGLTPQRLRDLLFEDGYRPAAMQLPDVGLEAEPCSFNASVLVRGQGTTDGFHSVALPIPSQVAPRLFRRGPERDRLAALSKEGINDAGLMLQKVLKPALFSLLEGGPESINFGKREVGAWVERAAKHFAEAWNSGFFPWLWRSVEHPDPGPARREWLDALRAMAWTALQEAVARSPERSGRHYRARVQAEGLFRGCLFTVFPELKEEPHEHRTG
jgi:CRISPR system Cascade subunit CasA